MKADRFYTLVEEYLGGGCPPGVLAVDEAARTTHVVLGVLGRRLDHGARLRLASALPRRLAVELMAAPRYSEGDPIACVACELQIDSDTAAWRIECVTRALAETVGAPLLDGLAPRDLS